MPESDSAYDDLPDAVLTTDAAGVVTSTNPALERLLGRSVATMIGRPAPTVLPLSDGQGRDWWTCMRPYDGLVTRTRFPEQLLRTPDPAGSEIEVLLTGSLHRAGDRSVRAVVLCLRDTRARIRQERRGADLVSVVAHELRSPLTSVKGFTATLLAKWDRFTDDQKRLMLQTVNADADRVTRLITELLDVSRIESGRLELRRQVVDLATIVRRDVEARITAGEAEERFVVTAATGLPELWGDPDKLAQVVANIVENALRHGAGTVSVSVGSSGDGGVRLGVTDEGDGVPVEQRGRVFAKFWRGSRRAGTGLGLFVAKGIVDAHNGRIDVEDAEGGGALVAVTLPPGTPDFAL